MPPTSTGKWVSRVAATGGGRTYRGQVPVNWYAALIVLVVLGLVSIIFSRYEYQHPHKAASTVPAVGQTLYAGYAFDICGTVQPPLAASTNAEVAPVTTPGVGVLDVSPKTPETAGNNATLGLFFSYYKGTGLTPTTLTVNKKTYRNGETCPAGSKDAGKKGQVEVEVWPNPLGKTGTIITSNASSYKITPRALFTFGFVPAGTALPKPSQSVVNEVLAASASVVNNTTTTTTVPSSTTTTVPSSTTTTTTPTSTTTTKA